MPNNLLAYSCHTIGNPMIQEMQGDWYRRTHVETAIGWLEKSLRLAVGELSAREPHTETHPTELYDKFIQAGQRED